MARVIFILLLMCSTAIKIQGQQTLPADKASLQNVVVGLFNALSDLDADKAKSFCAPDVTILESGKVWNFDSLAFRITARKAKAGDFKRINTIDFIETKSTGETAWLSYYNHAAITAAGKTINVKWLESVVLKKFNNEWKICLLHSTELERTQ